MRNENPEIMTAPQGDINYLMLPGVIDYVHPDTSCH